MMRLPCWRTSRSTSTTCTIMPIGSNSNGSGPSVSHPQSPSTSEPEPVTGNGPFDLSEMERLANELFRELPGAVLPGLDAEQLVTVSLTTEAERGGATGAGALPGAPAGARAPPGAPPAPPASDRAPGGAPRAH